MIKENPEATLRSFAVVFAAIGVIIETELLPLKELENPERFSAIAFMAAFTVIFIASILEIREEIRVKRMNYVEYIYPEYLYRLGIIIAFDAIVFIFFPMLVVGFLVTVFG